MNARELSADQVRRFIVPVLDEALEERAEGFDIDAAFAAARQRVHAGIDARCARLHNLIQINRPANAAWLDLRLQGCRRSCAQLLRWARQRAAERAADNEPKGWEP